MCSVLTPKNTTPSSLEAEGSRGHGLASQLAHTTNETSLLSHWDHRFLIQALQMHHFSSGWTSRAKFLFKTRWRLALWISPECLPTIVTLMREKLLFSSTPASKHPSCSRVSTAAEGGAGSPAQGETAWAFLRNYSAHSIAASRDQAQFESSGYCWSLS